MFFIKNRSGRFLLLLITSAVLLGAVLLFGITGLDDKIFPNLKNYKCKLKNKQKISKSNRNFKPKNKSKAPHPEVLFKRP